MQREGLAARARPLPAFSIPDYRQWVAGVARSETPASAGALGFRLTKAPATRSPFLKLKESQGMMELLVTMDFPCCGCHHPVSLTVKCEGKGLAAGMRSVVALTISCPTCGRYNQLFFEPNGTVRSVTPYNGPRPLPAPSIN